MSALSEKFDRENSAKYVSQRVIFTSGKNLKPPFLFQYLIFSMIYFLH